MATQTGSLDLKAVKKAHDDATKYITKIDDDGIKVHPYDDTHEQADTANYARITSAGMEVVKDNVSRAKFGEVVRIGKEFTPFVYDYENLNESRIELDYHSIQLLDRNGADSVYFYVSDLRDADGDALVTETITNTQSSNVTSITLYFGFSTYSPKSNLIKEFSRDDGLDFTEYEYTRGSYTFTFAPALHKGKSITISYYTDSGSCKAFTFGNRGTGNIGGMSYAEGHSVVADGHVSHAEGYRTHSSGKFSHAEGWATEASNLASHAEGYGTISSGEHSHAEGNLTQATLDFAHAEGSSSRATSYASHAEGNSTLASGMMAHSEGISTVASGRMSHAEGSWSYATGDCSHAQNRSTVATSPNQTAIGKYNEAVLTGGSGVIIDPYTYTTDPNIAFMIGNGTDNATNKRSNAFSVDWDGNVKLYMPPTYEGTSSTSPSTTTKVVNCPDFTLEEGAIVFVTFEDPTTTDTSLNVNNTGSKYAMYNGSRINGSNGGWIYDETVMFKYDGTYWQRLDQGDDIDADIYKALTDLGWTDCLES